MRNDENYALENLKNQEIYTETLEEDHQHEHQLKKLAKNVSKNLKNNKNGEVNSFGPWEQDLGEKSQVHVMSTNKIIQLNELMLSENDTLSNINVTNYLKDIGDLKTNNIIRAKTDIKENTNMMTNAINTNIMTNKQKLNKELLEESYQKYADGYPYLDNGYKYKSNNKKGISRIINFEKVSSIKNLDIGNNNSNPNPTFTTAINPTITTTSTTNPISNNNLNNSLIISTRKSVRKPPYQYPDIEKMQYQSQQQAQLVSMPLMQPPICNNNASFPYFLAKGDYYSNADNQYDVKLSHKFTAYKIKLPISYKTPIIHQNGSIDNTPTSSSLLSKKVNRITPRVNIGTGIDPGIVELGSLIIDKIDLPSKKVQNINPSIISTSCKNDINSHRASLLLKNDYYLPLTTKLLQNPVLYGYENKKSFKISSPSCPSMNGNNENGNNSIGNNEQIKQKNKKSNKELFNNFKAEFNINNIREKLDAERAILLENNLINQKINETKNEKKAESIQETIKLLKKINRDSNNGTKNMNKANKTIYQPKILNNNNYQVFKNPPKYEFPIEKDQKDELLKLTSTNDTSTDFISPKNTGSDTEYGLTSLTRAHDRLKPRDRPQLKLPTVSLNSSRTESPVKRRQSNIEIRNQNSFEAKNPGSFEAKNPNSFEIKNPSNFEIKNQSSFETKNPSSFEVKNLSSFDIKNPSSFEVKNLISFEIRNPSNFEVKNPSSFEVKSLHSFEVKNPSSFDFKNPNSFEAKNLSSFDFKNPNSFEAKNLSSFESKNPINFDMKNPNSSEVKSPHSFEVKNPSTKARESLSLGGIMQSSFIYAKNRLFYNKALQNYQPQEDLLSSRSLCEISNHKENPMKKLSLLPMSLDYIFPSNDDTSLDKHKPKSNNNTSLNNNNNNKDDSDALIDPLMNSHNLKSLVSIENNDSIIFKTGLTTAQLETKASLYKPFIQKKMAKRVNPNEKLSPIQHSIIKGTTNSNEVKPVEYKSKRIGLSSLIVGNDDYLQKGNHKAVGTSDLNLGINTSVSINYNINMNDKANDKRDNTNHECKAEK